MNPFFRQVANIAANIISPVRDPFARDVAGLADAPATETVALGPSESYDLRAGPVRKRLGDDTVKMLAYNSSIPGPTLQVQQGSEITIDFTNELALATTVHWHGLRLDNRFDGVPQEHHGMQPAVPPGGSFRYRLQFPDPGCFWYHPHLREDYTQEHGLYGNIIVVPADPHYWAPVNRELTLVLDDILIERGKIAPFSQSSSNRTAMGRFGNVMLVNGATAYRLVAQQGEVVRLYLTNTANVRSFNVRIPGARIKLVGGDNGCVEREAFVEEVLISPSERVIVEILFERAGSHTLEHRTPDRSYALGTIEVGDQPAQPSFVQAFATLRQSAELLAERRRMTPHVTRPPDKTVALVAEMPGMRHHGGHHVEPIEWEDTMEAHNRMTSPANMHWKIIDQATGAANHDIDWAFTRDELVKIRITNDPHSDHPMQHPFHIHGQRFLVLSRDGIPNDNLAWKDTVLIRTGETVDLLVEMSNPGHWMAHCHIAEHLEGGMMFSFHVQ